MLLIALLRLSTYTRPARNHRKIVASMDRSPLPCFAEYDQRNYFRKGGNRSRTARTVAMAKGPIAAQFEFPQFVIRTGSSAALDFLVR